MSNVKIKLEFDKNNGKTEHYFLKMKKLTPTNFLEEAGKLGVSLLSDATPKDTGLTAASWMYEIEKKDKDSYDLYFKNSNIVNGAPLVLMLQYGHATAGGGYVSPRDFINPITKQLQEQLSNDIWKEAAE